jgi:serine/threonine protein phosphatase 1
MFNHTLKLSLNSGRHLVVGDIHGRYDAFVRLLDAANYDPLHDIIYSVGDMIDRGPDSVKVVQFFQQDRCYAVKGNHELMSMSAEWLNVWYRNGGDECLQDLRRHNCDLTWLYNTLSPLPWVIDVGEDHEEHAFRVIHAEMPPHWSEMYFQKVLREALTPSDPTFSSLIWSRSLIGQAYTNIGHYKPADEGIAFDPHRCRTVFVGHTPIDRPIQCGDHWFLDTYAGHRMTMIDAVTHERFSVEL